MTAKTPTETTTTAPTPTTQTTPESQNGARVTTNANDANGVSAGGNENDDGAVGNENNDDVWNLDPSSWYFIAMVVIVVIFTIVITALVCTCMRLRAGQNGKEQSERKSGSAPRNENQRDDKFARLLVAVEYLAAQGKGQWAGSPEGVYLNPLSHPYSYPPVNHHFIPYPYREPRTAPDGTLNHSQLHPHHESITRTTHPPRSPTLQLPPTPPHPQPPPTPSPSPPAQAASHQLSATLVGEK